MPQKYVGHPRQSKPLSISLRENVLFQECQEAFQMTGKLSITQPVEEVHVALHIAPALPLVLLHLAQLSNFFEQGYPFTMFIFLQIKVQIFLCAFTIFEPII